MNAPPAARMPAEWSRHDAVWIGYPSDPLLWEADLDPARDEAIAFARVVHADGRGERVMLVAATQDAADDARARAGDWAEIVLEGFGDIWLRDTGPIMVIGADGERIARDFGFNGWGGKYELAGDDDVAERLAIHADLRSTQEPWVFEGGAIDVDGTGLAVTTEQCLLNPNRNSNLSRSEVEQRLHATLGIDRLLWLGEGLAGDHTDGHVDNLARFVGEGRIAIPQAAGDDDPNAAVYTDAAARAAAFGLEVVRLPSPGRVEVDGEVIPASHMNFYIGNAAVVIPLYGTPSDEAAVAAIGALFPDRQAVGLRADHILTGGGSFHCMSQQLPVAQGADA